MPEFRINIVHSTSHEVFPKIIVGILVILGIMLLIQGLLRAKREKRAFFSVAGRQFFTENYNKVKFWGTVLGLILLVLLMPILGFIFSGILFMLFFNVLYSGRKGVKDIAISLSIAVVETMSVWFIFGYLFEITLP